LTSPAGVHWFDLLLLPPDEVASWLKVGTTMRGGEMSEEGGDCPDGGS
jgi:hypothetical protein